MKISTKITAVVVLFSMLAIFLTSVAMVGLGMMKTSLDTIADDQFSSLKLAAIDNEKATRRHQLAFEILSESDAASRAALKTEFASETSAMQAILDQLKPYIDGPDVERFNTIQSSFSQYNEMEGKLLSLVETGQRDAAEAFLQNDMTSVFDKSDAAFDGLVKQQSDDVDAAQVSAAALSGTINTTMVASALLGLVIIGSLSVWMALRQIVGPVNKLSSVMGTLASGNLAVEVDGQARRDEIGTMAKAVQVFKAAGLENKRLEAEAEASRAASAVQRDRQSAIDNAKAEDLKVFVHHVEAGFDALSSGDLTVRMQDAVAPEFEPIRTKFNTSVESLEGTVGSVVSAVGTMRTGLNEITVAAGDLSQRTEQQAASLEETVAALAEVTRGINGTATEATKAQTTASTALKNAEKGGAVVGQAVEAMSQIEQSSDKIGKIIGVIDEIAFQTNLLALNAGVEAARAGEAGRGFAVVAQEVRGLAQRSAEAAKEIKDLIATSSAQVGHGVELVTASGKSLAEIVAQVAEMNDVVTGIAKSSSEQSLSLKEVATAADQMDKVTQQNAAMVEETTAAAQTLLGETDDLASLIQRFRTSRSEMQSPAARAPSRKSKAPAHRPVAQMRTTGTGGAALKAAPAAEGWSEF